MQIALELIQRDELVPDHEEQYDIEFIEQPAGRYYEAFRGEKSHSPLIG